MDARHAIGQASEFALTTTMIGDTVTALAVRGELDIATVGQFEAALHRALAAPGITRLVLDFASLTFLDASSITALHLAHRVARRRGIALSATNCRAIVRRVLEISDLYGHLTQSRTCAQAA